MRVPVLARVARYQLSAHADRPGLVPIIDRIRPAATMLVHGNRRDQAAFRESLRASGRPPAPTGPWRSG
jgi:Cft2 family RNA processing exonuclease